MHDVFFRVADADFRIRFSDNPDWRKLLPSYLPFLTEGPEATPIFTLDVSDTATDTQAVGEEIGVFDCGDCSNAVYHLPEGGYKIVISNFRQEPRCALLTNMDFSQCRATLYGNLAGQAFGLNNALMIAFAFAGAKHSICLMHASVPMKEGKAYLFLGKSGTGKSTHSRLWLEHIPGTDLLNDDNPAVRIISGETYVYGTPWSGKTPCYRNMKMRAGGFLRLEQAPENIIRREKGVKCFASVISSCSTMIWDKPSYNCICHTMARIAETVPVYYLRCRADREAAILSYRTMS